MQVLPFAPAFVPSGHVTFAPHDIPVNVVPTNVLPVRLMVAPMASSKPKRAFVRLAPLKLAFWPSMLLSSEKCVPVRLLFDRLMPVKVLSLISPDRLVFEKFEFVKLVFRKVAPLDRVALLKFVLVRLDPENVAFVRLRLFKFWLVRSAPLKLAPVSVAPVNTVFVIVAFPKKIFETSNIEG